MRCSRCNREMDHAFLWIGKNPVGPKCARKMGLTTDRVRYKWVPIVTQTGQLALFEITEVEE